MCIQRRPDYEPVMQLDDLLQRRLLVAQQQSLRPLGHRRRNQCLDAGLQLHALTFRVGECFLGRRKLFRQLLAFRLVRRVGRLRERTARGLSFADAGSAPAVM